MRDNSPSKEKTLRMRAARMHIAADKALLAEDRIKMHRAARLLDEEANGLASETDREALFSSH